MSMDENREPAGRGKSGSASGLAAFAVVLVVVLLWWLLSGNGPQGPAGNDSRFAVRDGEATGDGSIAPPAMTNQNGVRIDSFVLEATDRIALNYTTGAPECTGALDTPEVLETDAAVTVTLTLRPPEPPPDGPCPELAKLATVRVDLDAALADRSVLDGSFARRVLVAQTGTANE